MINQPINQSLLKEATIVELKKHSCNRIGLNLNVFLYLIYNDHGAGI